MKSKPYEKSGVEYELGVVRDMCDDVDTGECVFSYRYISSRHTCHLTGSSKKAWIASQVPDPDEVRGKVLPTLPGYCYTAWCSDLTRRVSLAAELGQWPTIGRVIQHPELREGFNSRSLELVHCLTAGRLHLAPRVQRPEPSPVSVYPVVPEHLRSMHVGGLDDIGGGAEALEDVASDGSLSQRSADAIAAVEEQLRRDKQACKAAVLDKGWSFSAKLGPSPLSATVIEPMVHGSSLVDVLAESVGYPRSSGYRRSPNAGAKTTVLQLLPHKDDYAFGTGIEFRVPIEVKVLGGVGRDHPLDPEYMSLSVWDADRILIDVPPDVRMTVCGSAVEIHDEHNHVMVIAPGDVNFSVMRAQSEDKRVFVYPLESKVYHGVMRCMSFDVFSTDARFLRATARMIVHRGYPYAGGVGATLSDDGKVVPITDPLDSWNAIGEERVEHAGKPPLMRFEVRGGGWRTVKKFRTDHPTAVVNLMQGLTVLEPDAAVGLRQGIDAYVRFWKDGPYVGHRGGDSVGELSYRVMTCVDAYCMDGGGPSDSGGYSTAV